MRGHIILCFSTDRFLFKAKVLQFFMVLGFILSIIFIASWGFLLHFRDYFFSGESIISGPNANGLCASSGGTHYCHSHKLHIQKLKMLKFKIAYMES